MRLWAAILVVGLGPLSPAWAQRPAYPIRPPPAIYAPAPAEPAAPALRPDQVNLLRRALAGAAGHGLDPAAYIPNDLDALLSARDPIRRAQGQTLLIDAVIRYGQALHSGRLTVETFDKDWGLRPSAFDAAGSFYAALEQDRLNAWLDQLAPPYAGYESLRQALGLYRDLAARGGWPRIPAGPALKLGALDTRTPMLRLRLSIEDRQTAPDGGPVFDARLAEAVMRAQKRFGLEPTGVVDRVTLAALNRPVEDRIGQIVANMERWRWLPAALPADRIQVNIAAAILTVFEGDTPVMSMRAVTGRPNDMTPMLRSTIHSVVLNPPWNVPAGIAAKELYPKGADYLARNNFINVPTGDGGYRLQQRAGPGSALGQVKFDFDNPYAVYLHDTPTRATFSRYSRLASHGCVRLEKAATLAHLVLRDDPAWPAEAIDERIATGDTVRVPLRRPMAVFLLYWTAYVAPDGQVNFRDDPYGWDGALLRRLPAFPLIGANA